MAAGRRRSDRLACSSPYTMEDAAEVYAGITPGITRYMRWEPPPSFEAFRARNLAELQAEDGPDRTFVIRHGETSDCLGVCAVEGVAAAFPEVGLRLRADALGRGFGSETVAALIAWTAPRFGRSAFDDPVAVDKVASRRIADGARWDRVGAKAKRETRVCDLPHPAPMGDEPATRSARLGPFEP